MMYPKNRSLSISDEADASSRRNFDLKADYNVECDSLTETHSQCYIRQYPLLSLVFLVVYGGANNLAGRCIERFSH